MWVLKILHSAISAHSRFLKIIDVPLAELLNPDIYREEIWQWQDGKSRPVFFFELIGDTVWGATASMLRQFLLVLLSIDQTK